MGTWTSRLISSCSASPCLSKRTSPPRISSPTTASAPERKTPQRGPIPTQKSIFFMHTHTPGIGGFTIQGFFCCGTARISSFLSWVEKKVGVLMVMWVS
ncbi:hypothetical protein SLA2020_518070 [Shorea laevis]